MCLSNPCTYLKAHDCSMKPLDTTNQKLDDFSERNSRAKPKWAPKRSSLPPIVRTAGVGQSVRRPIMSLYGDGRPGEAEVAPD